MAPLLTVEELRRHVPSGLSDTALRDLLDAAEEDLEAARGVIGAPITERHLGGSSVIVLERQAASVASVVESADDVVLYSLGADDVTDDYRLEPDLRSLRRLASGTNPLTRWYGEVDVTYTPVDDTAQRIRDEIALVKLDLSYDGNSYRRVGDYSSGGGSEYERMREQILNGHLQPDPVGFR